jgi:hypothetical protein
MKNIVLGILMLMSSLVYSQTDSSYRNLRITSTTLAYAINIPRPQVYYQPTPYVNLNLKVNTPLYNYNDDNRKKVATVIFVSGLAFTAASLLEDPYSFDTFWQQTPRQIMFCVGVGFTLGGGIALLKE